MHLPQATATPAIHILSGLLPIKALLDKQTLTQFVSFIRDPSTKEAHIIKRQALMKGEKSHSYVVLVKELLSTYNLPTIFYLINRVPSKWAWKNTVKQHVADHWVESIKEQADTMSTLKYLYVEGFKPKQLHPLWTPYDITHIGVMRSCNMAKIVVGRYYLEDDYAKFKGGPASCKLCTKDKGNLRHFVLTCTALEEVRAQHLSKIRVILHGIHVEEGYDLLQGILDPQVLNPDMAPDTLVELIDLSKQLLYKLHQRRSTLLGNPRPLPHDSTPQCTQ